MSKIRIDVKLTEHDIFNFQKVYFRQNITFYIIISFLTILFTATAVYSTLSSKQGPSSSLVISLIFALILFAVLVLLFRKQLNKSVKDMIRSNNFILKKHSYEINDSGINITWKNGQILYKWDQFYKSVETKDSFLFFTTEQQVYYIPKRFLNGFSDISLIRNYIEKIPKSRVTK